MRVIQLRNHEPLFKGLLYNPDSESPYRITVNDVREMFAFLRKILLAKFHFRWRLQLAKNKLGHLPIWRHLRATSSFLHRRLLVDSDGELQNHEKFLFGPCTITEESFIDAIAEKSRHGKLLKSYPANI